MAYISIWDLDYYYAKNKTNCFNTDAMKISSYHKQLGDTVNFVLTEADIFRPYDKYYIFKTNSKLPEPPIRLLLDKGRVRWWGKGVPKGRITWHMNDIMLGCRPDYQLYPNMNTKLERAEQIRLFNNKAEPLAWIQQWDNTYKNKAVLVTDNYMWFSADENIIKALDYLSVCKNVIFLEPIWIEKINNNQLIKEKFFNLNFARSKSALQWVPITKQNAAASLNFLTEFKTAHPRLGLGIITFDYRNKQIDHWQSKQQALEDFAAIRQWIIYAKQNKIPLRIYMTKTRLETPYYELFEALAEWADKFIRLSWLEWLTKKYIGFNKNLSDMINYWNHPEKWHDVFRDLLLQTYQYKDFISYGYGPNDKLSEIYMPWNKWKEEFKYEI